MKKKQNKNDKEFEISLLQTQLTDILSIYSSSELVNDIINRREKAIKTIEVRLDFDKHNTGWLNKKEIKILKNNIKSHNSIIKQLKIIDKSIKKLKCF